MEKFFYEIFKNIPRQGPGDNEITKSLYLSLSHLTDKPEIIDIGCGKGVQTIELAMLTNGKITAVDNYPYFLKCLDRKASILELSDKIKSVQADMNDLPFKDKSFDLIWSEGAIFIMGIKEGISSWKRLLKKGGYLVFSDLVWKKELQTKELLEYWSQEYPNILTVDEVIHEGQRNDFEIIHHQPLPKESWLKNYLIPIDEILSELKTKNSKNKVAQKIYKNFDRENEIVMKYYNSFVYEYFILKLK
jgi:SAM-dependent methyltransferase